MIYMIFKNIQDEYEGTRGKLDRAKTHVDGNSKTSANGGSSGKGSSAGSGSNSTSKGHKTLYWVGASTAVVAVGVAAYFLLSGDPVKKGEHQLQ
jgi:hypothetical protein